MVLKSKNASGGKTAFIKLPIDFAESEHRHNKNYKQRKGKPQRPFKIEQEKRPFLIKDYGRFSFALFREHGIKRLSQKFCRINGLLKGVARGSNLY